jgi:hypothetical protein
MKRLPPVALLSALGLMLAGCAGSGGRLVVAGGWRAVPGVNLLDGARLLSPTRLAIVTVGSSSCPAVPDKLVVQSPHTIRIDLTEGSWRPAGNTQELVPRPPSSGICTTDLTTTPIVVAIDPKQIDVHHRLTVRLYYRAGGRPVVRYAPPL